MYCHLKPWHSWQVVSFHSFECQKIQTKNLFNENFNFNFDLRPLTLNTYGVR
jgi:hypothetical protein